MASTRKVLGQVDVAATTETTLYTVPAATSTVVSTVIVCNRAATAATFRVYVCVAGAGTDVKQYLYYDHPIDGNDSFPATLGITLAATDVVKVYASTTDVSFSAFGQEDT
jgi:hypothetical protein